MMISILTGIGLLLLFEGLGPLLMPKGWQQMLRLLSDQPAEQLRRIGGSLVVAAVGFVPKKAIGAADGIKGTFAYLIGDSFAKLGLGMIADGTPIFGLTGWAGTFAALDAAAIGCIVLMAMVAVLEERKIRRENRAQKLKVA